MRTRQLGSSELHLSTIGFGSWALGGGGWAFGWGAQDDEQSIQAIHRALDLGVNWIDTAAVYGLGHAEEIVARALGGRSERPLIATKCGLRWRSNRKIYPCLSAESVRHEAEESLRRLRVDVIDLYQIHWPNPPAALEEAWATIARLVEEGKVRYAGVSNFSVDQIEKLRAIHPVTSLQPPYSMLKREIESELLDYCAQNSIGVIAYSPMYCGLLTGAFDHERLSRLAADDWRHKDPAFREPTFSKVLELVDRLRPLAERQNRSLAELAIAWVLSRPEVTAAIVGGRRVEQVEQTTPAGSWQLSQGDVDEIEGILRESEIPPLT
jgi:aryl-alcohol dehydrogenase-like predicted oxidoreductase